MASRVSVNIGVNDTSRSGLARVRASLRRLERQISGMDPEIRVNLDDTRTRAGVRRVRRALRRLPRTVDVNVNLREPSRAGLSRWQRAVRAPFRTAAATLGGIMQDGIGQGIANGFKAGGPIGMAALAAVIAGSLGVIGAALSGLIVTALGLAFVGVAAASAAMSDEVARNWKTATKNMKEDFRSVGEPLIPVVHDAVHQLEELSRRIAPKFRQAMVEAAPAVDEFIDKLFDGIERFGKTAFDPLMESWKVFSPVFGDVFADFLEDLGENFADIANMVKNNSAEIELALGAVFGIISGIVEAIEFLGHAWINMVRGFNSAIDVLTNYGLIPLAKAALLTFDVMLKGLAEVNKFVPGLGPTLKQASENFSAFRDQSVAALDRLGESAASNNKKLDQLNKERILKANIKTWQAQLEQAKTKLKTVPASKEAKLKADIKDLQAKIAKARGDISLIPRTVGVNIIGRYSGFAGGVIPGQAHGGVRGLSAAATGGVRSNMTLVGERGPEIVNLAPGSRVRSNSDSRRLAGQGGGSDRMVLEIKSGGSRMDDLLVEIIRRAARNRGGVDPFTISR